MYDERLVSPMRAELASVGFEETRSAAQVDAVLGAKQGTVLVVVNSVCGCAAGNARPAVRMATSHAVQPDRKITVFAGNDREATAKARDYFIGYRPSSPSIALLRDGDVVKMWERHDIEGRDAHDLARELVDAFDTHCANVASK